ncbi:hypothetical protein F0919_08445 [Taibaiella lutea]|uniref:Uncharacterized protein n=1 Tax=Taibaiella lutea TaxID=2608001 RepID=A0A5M6CI02_9BACT|nr:hypothetical protein [Taibaiella lutea]KAA5534636.1 hypothetical protein F0919_08445 [Taibaiella lutea]
MRVQPTTKPIKVFIAKDYETAGIIQDEVVAIGENKYKSIKFRHTIYNETDFNYSLAEAEAFVNQKFASYTPPILIRLEKSISLLAI